jgi:hypothetical protein
VLLRLTVSKLLLDDDTYCTKKSDHVYAYYASVDVKMYPGRFAGLRSVWCSLLNALVLLYLTRYIFLRSVKFGYYKAYNLT